MRSTWQDGRGLKERGRTKDNFQLGTGQPFGLAAVRAVAKAKSGLRARALAVNVESVGMRENGFVAAAGLVGGDDAFSLVDVLRPDDER